MGLQPGKPSNLWSIILAGGEGERVRSLVQRWLGSHKPKQYCTFVGNRSMFQHTLDRATRLTSPNRTISVVSKHHRQEALSQLNGRQSGTVLFQPSNRDTAAGVFFPLAYIRSHNPQATVVIYPSDHFVYPEDRFLETVSMGIQSAQQLRDKVALLGVAPDRLELEYGWIQPDRTLTTLNDRPIRSVRSFLEKPTASQADHALAKGALWNTLVLISQVDTLWNLGRQCFPELISLFDQLIPVIGTSKESRMIKHIYKNMPTKNFSSHLLQQAPEHVSVLELSGVLWSDWGKPERITETLRRIDRKPAFPLGCLERPFAPTTYSPSRPFAETA